MNLDIQKQTKNFKIRLAILIYTNSLGGIRLMDPRGLKVMYQKCIFITVTLSHIHSGYTSSEQPVHD